MPATKMGPSPASHFALVLPGAVARGAYEAGVIQVLAERSVSIDRIVATSSGALNGLAYAVGIRCGREKEIASKLVDAWIDEGGWKNSININIFNLLKGNGLSSSHGLLKLMRSVVVPCGDSKNREVELRIIITPLNGIVGSIGHKKATTYEKLMKFTGPDLDSAEGLARVFNVVAAACAFPGLYQPVDVPGLGACVDGGAVNNAPIGYALEESDVNRVIIPVAFPPLMEPGEFKGGLSFLNHLIAILINERLYRDLKLAQSINRDADQLKELKEKGFFTQQQLDKIQSMLSIHNVEITEVRPKQNLPCSPFAGFFSRNERISLVEAGRKAAESTLNLIPALNPEGVQTT